MCNFLDLFDSRQKLLSANSGDLFAYEPLLGFPDNNGLMSKRQQLLIAFSAELSMKNSFIT